MNSPALLSGRGEAAREKWLATKEGQTLFPCLADFARRERSRAFDDLKGDLETNEVRAGLPILAFADAPAFDAWLGSQGSIAPGLWLKLAKKGAPERTLTKPEAIDAALCHGWIDGQLDAYDNHYWLTRFTPRKSRSKWSASQSHARN